MSENIIKLMDFYEIEHQNKIFCTKLTVKNKKFAIMYDYDKKDEIEKFVRNFTEYLPYYVWNADALDTIDYNKNISVELNKISKKCFNSPNVAQRQTKVNGLYGEVFLDFYERVVKKSKLASTFASRRGFKDNNESKGFDNVLFSFNDNEIELIFAEAKFVLNKTSAKNSLVEDIIGCPATGDKKAKIGHLTLEFMNDYITFIVEKNTLFSDEDKEILRPFFKKLNNVLVNNQNNFISFLIEEKIKIKCVFFAIFQSDKFTPDECIDCYEIIQKNANASLKKIGFENFSVEIVFVPTLSKSLEIKGAIKKNYE